MVRLLGKLLREWQDDIKIGFYKIALCYGPVVGHYEHTFNVL